jgi:hypothetical protein
MWIAGAGCSLSRSEASPALKLIAEISTHGGISDPFWTLGGGTVLMFRYRHRVSKDIDIFVPDPQYLGYVTPRLSDVAAEMTDDYTEMAAPETILPCACAYAAARTSVAFFMALLIRW